MQGVCVSREVLEMRLTEDQAKEKLCPINSRLTHCAGSACMLWKWVEKAERDQFGNKVRDGKGRCGLEHET